MANPNSSAKDANFTPELQPTNKLHPFAAWCQWAIPAIYNGEMSYFELVSRFTYYVNKLLENVDALETDVGNLRTAFDQLQTYVNDYLTTVNFQNLVNNKLDEMAESGELSKLMEPYLSAIQQLAQDAKNDADAAKASAEQAQVSANNAAEQATNSANSASQALTQATNSANSAATAQTAANNAANSAAAANTASQNAITTANEAKQTANGAQQTANNANTTANGAQQTANNANTNANGAQQTASNALNTAQEALNKVNNIISSGDSGYNKERYEKTFTLLSPSENNPDCGSIYVYYQGDTALVIPYIEILPGDRIVRQVPVPFYSVYDFTLSDDTKCCGSGVITGNEIALEYDDGSTKYSYEDVIIGINGNKLYIITGENQNTSSNGKLSDADAIIGTSDIPCLLNPSSQIYGAGFMVQNRGFIPPSTPMPTWAVDASEVGRPWIVNNWSVSGKTSGNDNTTNVSDFNGVPITTTLKPVINDINGNLQHYMVVNPPEGETEYDPLVMYTKPIARGNIGSCSLIVKAGLGFGSFIMSEAAISYTNNGTTFTPWEQTKNWADNGQTTQLSFTINPTYAAFRIGIFGNVESDELLGATMELNSVVFMTGASISSLSDMDDMDLMNMPEMTALESDYVELGIDNRETLDDGWSI